MKAKKLLIGCMICLLAAANLEAQPKRSLPKALKGLEFGMSLAEFAEIRGNLRTEDLQFDKIRYRWAEKGSKDKAISKVIYYFDDEEEKVFYECIIFYNNLQKREAWLDKNYGPPNAENNTEWRFVADEGYELRAWRFEDRLVIVAVLPGTEWDNP